MTVLGIDKLEEFAKTHSDTRYRLKVFENDLRKADWRCPFDVKVAYPSVDFLKENHIIINIKGNNYRVLIQILYSKKVIIIKNIDTHDKYNRWKLN